MITTVTIAGMTTEHCKRAVFTALTGVPGIQRADVSMGAVTVEHDGTLTGDALSAALRDAIALVGYTVTDTRDDRRTLVIVDAGVNHG